MDKASRKRFGPGARSKHAGSGALTDGEVDKVPGPRAALVAR
jgi:hypothetical protein